MPKGKYGEGTCQYDKCKKKFAKNAPGQKFCGEPAKCKTLSYNESRRKDFGTEECRFCGKTFQKSKTIQYYCPRPATCKADYENARAQVNTVKQCRQCGEDFTVDTDHKVYCPECKDNVDPAAEARAKQEREHTKQEMTAALLDERNRTQVVKELTAAQDRVEGWQPKRFNLAVKRKYPEEQANIMFGDWHYGEKVTIEETGGLGEYNTEIARSYLARCVQAQAEIVGIQNDGGIPIRHCNAWLLGDIIPGEKIYKGQHTYIEEQTADQVVGAKNVLAETLLNMLDIYETITVRAVVGNHGRMGEKGEGPTWNNFDYLVYLWTRDLLKDCPQIEWVIPRSWFLVDDVMGWRFCAAHGDDVRMFQRIPWYGLERDVNDMSAMLWDIETSPPTYWLYAHFHMTEQAEQTHGERLMNGSLPGVSMLSVKGMKRRGRPSQTFFGLSESRGITWRYPLWLEKPKKKAA